MSHHRIILLNMTKTPSREELTTSERCIGDLFLAPLGLTYGGYITVKDLGKLAAQWIVPDDKFNAAVDFVESFSLTTHQPIFMSSVEVGSDIIERQFA